MLCSEKQRLLNEVTDALKLMISYHNAELEAVVRGELPFIRTSDDARYGVARELKDRFIQELR